jgi:hypothetical protein
VNSAGSFSIGSLALLTRPRGQSGPRPAHDDTGARPESGHSAMATCGGAAGEEATVALRQRGWWGMHRWGGGYRPGKVAGSEAHRGCGAVVRWRIAAVLSRRRQISGGWRWPGTSPRALGEGGESNVWSNQRRGGPGGRSHQGNDNGGGSQSGGIRGSTAGSGVREVSGGQWGEGLCKTQCKKGVGAKRDGSDRVPLLKRARWLEPLGRGVRGGSGLGVGVVSRHAMARGE